jgi:hypothetical protein
MHPKFKHWLLNHKDKVKVLRYDETITYTLLKSSVITVIGANHTYHFNNLFDYLNIKLGRNKNIL